MSFTYTISQIVTQAEQFATTATQQSTTTLTNDYLEGAAALADFINARMYASYAESIDISSTTAATYLANADTATVNAHAATGQAQLDYLVEVGYWSRLAYVALTVSMMPNSTA